MTNNYKIVMEKDTFFQYDLENECCIKINHHLKIPYWGSLEELSHVLLLKYNLPINMSRELIKHLTEFVNNSNLEYYNEKSNKLVKEFKKDPNIEDVTKDWEKHIREETTEYGEKKCASDEELFAMAYYKLVHSPTLEMMLQLEYAYAITVRQKVNEKDFQIKNLSKRQTQEMNKAVDRLEKGITELDINELATKHFEDQTFLQVQLTSELETIKEAQRREYREWLMQMLEQNEANSSLPTPKNSPFAPEPPSLISNALKKDHGEQQSMVLEESFTIHLGSQLKQMHNIRILAGDVMNLCAIKENQQLTDITPQLLQTALGLYSNDLCGLVLMTDTIIGSRLTKASLTRCK